MDGTQRQRRECCTAPCYLAAHVAHVYESLHQRFQFKRKRHIVSLRDLASPVRVVRSSVVNATVHPLPLQDYESDSPLPRNPKKSGDTATPITRKPVFVASDDDDEDESDAEIATAGGTPGKRNTKRRRK